MLKRQLIDMLRTVPETAVRIWAGGRDAKIYSIGDKIRIEWEGKISDVSPEAYFKAQEVAKILSVRWMGRMLRGIQDVLELRFAAEDVFMDMLFDQADAPSVLFVPSGKSASGYYRAMIPSEIMHEGGRISSHWTASIDLAKALNYKILWVQLLTSPILNRIAREAKAQGLKIVYDIDDRLDSIPVDNQARAVYTEAKQAEILEMVRLADLVTVSTDPLAEHIRSMGANAVRVVRNQLPANVIPRRHPPDPRFVRILWAGSPTHKRDLAIVAPAIRTILKRHAGKVRFTCMGERLPESLADCYEWIDLKEPVDFDMYHDALASIAADFGIAPLEVNPFNETKSSIKALEYAAAGYPMLLSPVGEYPHTVAAGLPAKLVADQDWEAELERMIARPHAERAAMGAACRDWVCANRCIGATKASQWATVIYELLASPPAPEKPELKLVT